MKPFDVIEQVRLGLVAGTVPAMAHTIALEHTEEALTRCIVTTVAHRAHTADQLL